MEYQRERFAGDLDARMRADRRLRVTYANAYEIDFGALPWRSAGPLLIVGNPPWVTTAALGRVPGLPLQPPRSNPNGLRGFAARTGAANFDVAEFFLLKLLRELRGESLQLALLVKESVARNVLRGARHAALDVAAAEIVRIDARAWFGAAVDACCLFISARPHGMLRERVPVRAEFGGPPVAAFDPLTPVPSGAGAIVFRQGIKHDAADVFELRRDAGRWINGYGDCVDIEAAYVYPLRKAGALHADRIEPTALIVPQRRLGEPTSALAERAPRLWRYLQSHARRIAARKSSIYRNAPPSAMFGIGPYSFAPWKVAVAGLYAEPRFRLVGPAGDRPVVFGDTAYFIGFECEPDGRVFFELCTSPAVAESLRARIVRGKRPVTKALLDSIDWVAAAALLEPVPDRLARLFSKPSAPDRGPGGDRHA